MADRYYEPCPLTVKQFKTDSNNPFFLFFRTGNIQQPFLVLTEGEMITFIAQLDGQIKDVRKQLKERR